MSDKKYSFFDIDGTLAIVKKVLESTQIALKRLRELGHYVFICNGRPINMFKIFFKNMPIVLSHPMNVMLFVKMKS